MNTNKRWITLIGTVLVLYILVLVTISASPYVNQLSRIHTIGLPGILIALYLVYSKFTEEKKGTLQTVFMVLALFGVLLSAYMTYGHFGTSAVFCEAPEHGEAPCDIINQSPESEIYGIPVSSIGILGYLALFSMMYLQRTKKSPKWLKQSYVLYAASIGLLFTVWLNYVQFFVYQTLCPLCELSATTIILLTIIAFLTRK